MEARAATPMPPVPRQLHGGALPEWAPYGVVAGSLALSTLVLSVAGSLSVALVMVVATVVSCVAIYAWSRPVEGPRRALDRLVTFTIVAAFGLALIPLMSLLYQVRAADSRARLGIPDRDAARDHQRRRSGPRDRRHDRDHRRGGADLGAGRDHGRDLPQRVRGGQAAAGAHVLRRRHDRHSLDRRRPVRLRPVRDLPRPRIRLGVMGSAALSVLMIPIVIRSAEEVLKVVPDHLREAAYALGTPKWKTIVKVVLPTAFAGLVTGVMIAIARIIGETAPLLVTTVSSTRSTRTRSRAGCRTSPSTPTASTAHRDSQNGQLRPRLGGGADPDRHRDAAQRRRQAGLSPVQDGDPLAGGGKGRQDRWWNRREAKRTEAALARPIDRSQVGDRRRQPGRERRGDDARPGTSTSTTAISRRCRTSR